MPELAAPVLQVMIAEPASRRRGLASEALMLLMSYASCALVRVKVAALACCMHDHSDSLKASW